MSIEKINEILSSNLSEEEKLEEIKKISTESTVESSTESTAESSTEPEFEKLKNLLNSEDWPEAVLEFQIADDTSEEDKTDRAEGIVDILIEESLENKKFLDFGCGEGHAVKYTSEDCANGDPTISVGYDIEKQGSLEWENDEKFLLTTDFEKVKAKGPFDVILIYDVLDHAENPAEVLNQVSSILKNNGTIYLRCHPWSGRHGGHAYRKINKAFVHLVFSEKELKNLGIEDNGHNNKVLFPIATYSRLFAGVDGSQILHGTRLSVNSPDVEDQEVEPFFKNNELVRKRILTAFEKDNWEQNCPQFQMAQCFLDYVIKIQ